MNWKEFFCRHDYIPIGRQFTGYGKQAVDGHSDIEVHTTHRYVTEYKCIKCDKRIKRKSSVINHFDRVQPFDSESTKKLLKD